jgi:hypothetical protein
MNTIVEFLNSKNLMFKTLDYFDLKRIKSRKKIKVLVGLDLKSNYHIIFELDAKSRFLQKDVDSLEELVYKIAEFKGHNFKYKALKITSPLCSKAKAKLQSLSYKVWDN